MSVAMPGLPLPNLDDRRWTDLVEEGRALIPLYAPEWTDHNLHDPGITLIELCAWLAEQDLFRIDRIGTDQIRKLLALAGVTAAPTRPASVVLSVTPAPKTATAIIIPGTEFFGTTAGGLLVRFRAVDETALTSAKLAAFQVEQQGAFLDRSRYLDRGEPFAAWGDDPGPGAAFLLGFDTALPADAWTSLDFTVRDPDESDLERDRLRAEAGASSLEHPAHHSVRLAWEVRTASGLWVPLPVSDETRSLTLNGRVRLRGSTLAAPARLGRVEQELFYVRARIVAGTHDEPPVLVRLIVNGVLAEQALVPSRARSDDQPTPYLAEHPELAGWRFERLAAGDGWPGQVRTVSAPAVAGVSPVILTHEGDRGKPLDRWIRWTIRPDFAASSRADSHVVLGAQEGTMTFGDGEHGRALPAGAVPYVAYLSTLAAAGNVPAGTVNAVTDGSLAAARSAPGSLVAQVAQPGAAWGGRDEESLDQVLARLLDGLNKTTRAVTAGDCESLALSVPGTAVAVARAAPEQHPDLPGMPAPGVVTVTILPHLPMGKPAPTPGLRRLVSCYLNRRGVPGSRIVVVGPVYREIVATLTLEIGPETRAQIVQAKVQTALDQFFHPLTGGPDGRGWPIGRDVYRSEVLQALARAGFDSVVTLDLALDGGPPQCGNLCLGPRGLPASGTHQVATVAATTRTRKVHDAP
jgi:predicted phage baseplate assembly protein